MMTGCIDEAMRIALTNPFSWPDVRRGSERFLHDLATYLASVGHDVTVIASHAGPETKFMENGITHIRLRQPFRSGAGRWLTPMHAFAWQTGRVLRENDYDVVHSLSYYDACGSAMAARTPSRTRLLMHIVGIPLRRYFRTIPHDRIMFEYALKRMDAAIVVSNYAQSCLRKEFQRDSVLLPPAVDLKQFSPNGGRPSGPPSFLFVGDVDERRKGAAALMRAIPFVLRSEPEARFLFSGNAGPDRQAALLSFLDERDRRQVEFLGVGGQSDLPALYRKASVTVLPAIWEAFGLALAESLACGTPVVGCKHAGIKDVVSSPEIGRLFVPGTLRGETTNSEGLARAMIEALELARIPSTASACRRRAEEFGWERLGPAIQELYSA